MGQRINRNNSRASQTEGIKRNSRIIPRSTKGGLKIIIKNFH